MNLYEKQYIGTLASSKDLEETNFRDNVFVNAQSYIQYVVKSKIIPSLPQPLFTGYMSCFDQDCDIKDDDYLRDDIRTENFLNQLKGKLFIFTYKVKESKYYNVSSAHIVPMPPSLNQDTMFYAVPNNHGTLIYLQ